MRALVADCASFTICATFLEMECEVCIELDLDFYSLNWWQAWAVDKEREKRESTSSLCFRLIALTPTEPNARLKKQGILELGTFSYSIPYPYCINQHPGAETANYLWTPRR